MINKKRVAIYIGVVILASLVLPLTLNKLYLAQRCSEYEGATGCTKQTTIPSYIETDSYGDSGGGYACSRKIQLVSYTVNKSSGKYYSYYPVDSDEARLLCHRTTMFEYKGKLTVLQKPEVLELISKYQFREVSIKALEFQYIEDKEFVHRLLPQFKNKEIGCIIVLETPNEKLVFLEDEELETFELMDYKIFEQNFRNVSEADKALFLDNLQ